MDLAKYNEIIERLRDLVDFYQRSNFSYNRKNLYLGNGEVLSVRYPKGRIAHLLGVDLEYLKGSNRFRKGMDTYECLIYFLDNAYMFGNLVQEGTLCFDRMFSKNIEGKLKSFKENLLIRNTDLVAVVKYDSKRAYQGECVMDGSDHYIIRQKNFSYYVLGLVQDEQNPTIYLPVTSRKYDDYTEFETFMTRIAYKQELTYIYNISTSNPINGFNQNFYLYQESRMKQLDRILKLSQKYSASAGVAADYLNFLKRTKTAQQSNNMNIEILKSLVSAIRGKKVLNISTEEFDNFMIQEEVMELISQYNDMICSGISNNEQALSSYSELVTKNQSLTEKYRKLKEELRTSQEEQKRLVQSNSQLQEQNDLYQQQLAIYQEAHQKVLSLTPSKDHNNE